MNALGIALVWCVAQVTLVGLLTGGVYLLVRRIRPAAGAPVVLTGLLLVVALSVFAWSPWPRWQLSSRSARGRAPGDEASLVAEADTATDRDAGSAAGPSAGGRAASDGRSSLGAEWWSPLLDQIVRPRPIQSEAAWRWPAMFAISFLAGVLASAAWLGAGIQTVRWHVRRSQPLTDTGLADLVDVLRAELGCRRPIQLRQSALLATAATIGWRRPVILLPLDWRGWTEPQRRAVLAHEIAHVRNDDFLAVLLGQVGVALHFYHPLLHWLMGRLRLEQELIADAAAASVSGGQRQYLMTIAELVLAQNDRPLVWPARSFLPTRTTFLRRITMLRDSKLRFDRLSPAARAVAVGLVVLGGLLAAGLRGSGSIDSLGLAAEAVPAKPAARQLGIGMAADRIDLQDLPIDAQLFAVVRPAAIFQRPELAEYGKLMGENQGHPWIPVTELEQVTFVLMSVPESLERGPRDRLVIYRTVKPFDFREHLRHLPAMTEQEHAGKKYLVHKGPAFEEVAIARPDDRTLVEAESEATVKAYLSGATGLPKFVDRAQWKQFQGDHLLAAVRADVIEKITRLERTPEALTPFAPLWQGTSWGLGGIRVGEETLIHGLAVAKTDADAEQVVKTLEAARVLALNVVQQTRSKAKQQRITPQDALVLWAAASEVGEKLLNQAKIVREGTVVRVRTAAVLGTVVKNLFPSVVEAREAARRAQASNNLKQIALAMHNYHDTYRHFPSAVLLGPDGKTPYSWRVALLPFVEQDRLYKQYRLDEPWDSPNNRKVLEQMPAVYRCPKEPADSKNASYFLPVGTGAIFHDRHAPQIREILDGTSNTIMVVEAKRDIPWTKPEDIPFDPENPLPKLGGFFPEGFLAALADGSVHFLPRDIDETLLRLLITAADRQPIREIPHVPRRMGDR